MVKWKKMVKRLPFVQGAQSGGRWFCAQTRSNVFYFYVSTNVYVNSIVQPSMHVVEKKIPSNDFHKKIGLAQYQLAY